MRTKTLLVFLCFAVLALAVQAQEFWQKKEPAKWSESECKRLFNDSPWAKGHEVSFNQSYSVSAQSGNVRKSSGGLAESPQTGQSTGYVVAFWSALPVRQAFVQYAKIRSKYDKLPADKKEAADKDYNQILKAEFPDSIVLRVSFYSTMREIESDLAAWWQQQTEQSMKNSFYLISHGQRIAPLQFKATPNDFTIVFPRQINGEPIAKPGDKSLAIEFQHPNVQNEGEARVYVEFPMKKMLDANGKLVF